MTIVYIATAFLAGLIFTFFYMKNKYDSLIAIEKAENKILNSKLTDQKEEVERLREQVKLEFEVIASKLLEEKSRKFTEQNKINIDGILSPLKEKILLFEKKVEDTHKENLQVNAALKQQIIGLKDLNEQITKEAERLTKAIKGDSKVQGGWGEYTLELILQKAGLVKDTHYSMQESLRNEEGNLLRPDCVIYLPEEKHLIIDSKISFRDYEAYFNESEEEKQQYHLKQHISCIRKHISDLGHKNYQQLAQLNAPDYVLMFFAAEPALHVAMQHDDKLFLEALDKNIVLVAPSTLLAIMRTVSFIWKQENQKKNVLEIARQSGDLYDKFVNLLADLEKVGDRMDSTRNAYDDVLKKLNGRDNLIRKVERIKELGAGASKHIPAKWLEQDQPEAN